MNKKILDQYVDACRLVVSTEKDLKKLEASREVAADKVMGSMSEFPYIETSFKVEGKDDAFIWKQRRLLETQKEEASRIKGRVEEWLKAIPLRTRRVVQWKYFEGWSWDQIADELGRGYSGEAIRKETERILKEF